MDRRLLDILCCPVSKRPLRLLGKEQLAVLNRAIGSGEVLTVAQQPVRNALSQGLLTDDGKVIYRIEDDIPVMLAEEGIGTTQLNDFPR